MYLKYTNNLQNLSSLGGYDKEEKAAKAYDLAALKYWGPTTHINFPVCRFVEMFFFFLKYLQFYKYWGISVNYLSFH